MAIEAPSPAVAARPHAIALVDDHELVGALRTALRLRPDLHLVGAFPTVDALLRSDLCPQVVLLDLRLADGPAPAANVRRIRQRGSDVLAFTSGEDAHLVREALRADVLGLLRRSASAAALIRAIDFATQGLPVITREWAHAIESDPQLPDAALSPQEARVLQLFADGAKALTVASELRITVGTLEDCIRGIRAKYAQVGRAAPTGIGLYTRPVEYGLLPVRE